MKHWIRFFVAFAMVATVAMFGNPAQAQEPPPEEDWVYLGVPMNFEDWAEDAPVTLLVMRYGSASNLPAASPQQGADFCAHMLEDPAHQERLPLVRTLLEGLRAGTIVADQLGYAGQKGVAFFTLPDYGKVILLWGPSVRPTIFDGVSPDYVRSHLQGIRRVVPDCKKARHALSRLAECLLKHLPQSVPEPVPARERQRAPKPTQVSPTPFVIFGAGGLLLLLIIIISFLGLLGGRKYA